MEKVPNKTQNKKLKPNIVRVVKSKLPPPNTVTENKLKLLVTVVNRGKSDFYLDLLHSFNINLQFVALANGTADAKMLNLLGLNDSKKSVIFGIIQENKIADCLHTLEQKFNTIKGGKGVAFTIPLTSVIGTLIYGFLSNNKMAVKEETK